LQAFEFIQKFEIDLKPHGPDLLGLLAHNAGHSLERPLTAQW
jgi:hypothetical protein